MRVAGVFVGLSAHSDQGFDALSFGHRDAEALFAHFADANEQRGGAIEELRVLINEEATVDQVRAAIAAAIRAANEGRADVVLVHFSCHGSISGDLALYDVNADDVPGSCLPVREVITQLATVQNAAAVLTLDCCFAGSALGMEGSPNRESFDGLMREMTSDSRFVLWAATPGQKAYEDTALAHGYLTYALLKELEVARASAQEQLPIPTWLTSAASRVGTLARAAGRVQTAGCYAMVTSPRDIPVARVGAHLQRLAESEGVPSVDATLDSLSAHGLHTQDIEALRIRIGAGATLNRLQQEAVSPGGVLAGRSLLVRAPTSGGKTLIAEMAMLRQWRLGRKTVVLLPMRALVHEQADAARETYGDALKLRIIVSTGEVAEDDDLLRHNQFDVAYLTYEKFVAIVSAKPRFLEEIGVVVLDEIQMIEDDQRGRTLELLLVRLQRLRRERQWPQLIVLCAELANLDSLQAWLGITAVGSAERPIPLSHGVVDPSGRLTLRDSSGTISLTEHFANLPAVAGRGRPNRWPNDIRAHSAIAVVRNLVVTQGKQVLVFCASGWQAMRVAEWLADDMSLPPEAILVAALAVADVTQQHVARAKLAACAAKGVAFHIGDLDKQERRAVEAGFRSGALRVVLATTTLAMGVNSPTDVVVFVDNKIFKGEIEGEVEISVALYRNMAGRAGRLLPGGPSEGTSLLIAESEPDARRLLERYITSPPPALESRLGKLSTEDLAVALLQLQPHASVVQLAEDLGRTYCGFLQPRKDEWIRTQRRALEESLAQLQREGFVVVPAAGRWSLSARGRIVSAFGMEVNSARRLLHAIETIRQTSEPIDVLALTLLAQLTVEMDRVPMPRGETAIEVPEQQRGPLRNRPTLWGILIDATGLAGNRSQVIGNRVHRLMGIVPWLRGERLSDIERRYSRDSRQEAVAGKFRGMVERVLDVLPAVANLLLVELPTRSNEIKSAFGLARHQLAVGGGAAAAELHALRLSLRRHQCLQLVGLGITGEVALREALVLRRPELEAALATAEVHALEARLNDNRARRRRGPKVEQLAFDGFGAETPV